MRRLTTTLMIAGAVVLLLDLFILLLGPLVAPYEPNRLYSSDRSLGPSATYPLGTDSLGRDLLSRKLYGAVKPPNQAIVIAARDTSKGKIIIVLEALALVGIIGMVVIQRRRARPAPIFAIVAGVILVAALVHLVSIVTWLPPLTRR